MRRLYRERIFERLRRGDLVWLARNAARYLGIRWGRRLGRPLTGPILGTLITNYSCNLRCEMCDLPLRVSRYKEEGLQSLSTHQLIEVIDDFARIGTLGLGFTGGEPLLRKDIYELLSRSKQNGLITHLNTNGTFMTEEAIETLLEMEIDSINLSLDGATAATHDRIRGKQGNFEEVIEAARGVDRLRKKRTNTKHPLRLKLVLVLSESNVDEALELVDLRKKLGADSIDFIPVHDFNEPGSSQENRNGPSSAFVEKADRVIENLLRLKSAEPIDNSGPHLKLMKLAFRGLPNPTHCFAGYNSLAVDLYGRIFPCVPWSNADRAVGQVNDQPLAEFWRSEQYRRRRPEVDSCRACYLNCQTELNLVFSKGTAQSISQSRAAV